MIKPQTGGPDLERLPVIPLREQLEFIDIVQAETTTAGRRMIDWWATAEDVATGRCMNLEADQRLDATLLLMWRPVSE